VDPTPRDDVEFSKSGNNTVRVRMDLLSIVAHELGHLVGLSDTQHVSHTVDVMGGTLATGTGRLPTSADVESATLEMPALSPVPWARYQPVRRR